MQYSSLWYCFLSFICCFRLVLIQFAHCIMCDYISCQINIKIKHVSEKKKKRFIGLIILGRLKSSELFCLAQESEKRIHMCHDTILLNLTFVYLCVFLFLYVISLLFMFIFFFLTTDTLLSHYK